jgi:hypothetical protein
MLYRKQTKPSVPLVNCMTMPSCVCTVICTEHNQNSTDDTPLVLPLLSGGGYGHIGGSVSLIDTYRRYCTVGGGRGGNPLRE